MDIRNILVSLDPLASPAPTLGLAISLAEKLGSKVSASAAARPWFEPIGAEMGPAAVTLYDEQQAIAASIPWTRVVEDRRSTFEGVDDSPSVALSTRI